MHCTLNFKEYRIAGVYCKRKYIFANHMILLSEEIFAISIFNRRYIGRYMDQKCVLALIFANAFEITKLKDL